MSLADLDKVSLKALLKNRMQNILKVDADHDVGVEVEPAVKDTNISTISGVRLLTVSNAVQYYKLVGRTLDLVI